MTVTERLDRLQRRHPALGLPIAVAYKYADDHGSYLAALITYYGFVSLFPLLLLLSTVLQWVLVGNPEAQQAVLHSALGDFPVVGQELQDPGRLGGGLRGLVIGLLAALYGALGVAQAIQHATNTAWAVPKNDRPNPLKARLRSLLLLATAGIAVLGTTVLTTLGTTARPIGAEHGALAKLAVSAAFLVGSVALNAGVFLVAFRTAAARHLTWRQVAPGAVLAALAWQLLQSFGATYVQHVIRHASATNGVFALVLGLLAFLYLASAALVLCIEIDVVRVEHLHPRALLTPFTDDVDLTRGDEKVYEGSAKAQRSKGFERVHVEFDDRGTPRGG